MWGKKLTMIKFSSFLMWETTIYRIATNFATIAG